MSSCALCRLARTACDKSLPCERCVRLGLAHQCFRPPVPAKRGRPSRQPSSARAHPAVNILPHTCAANDAAPAAPPPTSVVAPTFPPAPIPLPSFYPPLQSAPSVASPGPVSAPLDQCSSSEQPCNCRRPKNTESQGDLCGVTASFLLDTIVALKVEVRTMTDKVRRMKKKNAHQAQQFQADMRETQRRLQVLEDDNTQLRKRLVSHEGSDTNTTTSSSMLASTKRRRTVRGDGQNAGNPMLPSNSWPEERLSSEIYWCFPFLQRFDISLSRFVVDDLQKAVLVIQNRPDTQTSIIFATHQFCTTSGFSMSELIGRELLLSVVPRSDKPKFIQAWLAGSMEGWSDIVQGCYHLEHKQGQLVKLVARHQFFVDRQRNTYVVTCIDQVLGMDFFLFSTKELHKREKEEWDEVINVLTSRPGVASPTA